MLVQLSELKKLVSTAAKGASNDKFLPITSLITLKVVDNQLEAYTTDGDNYVCVRGVNVDEGQDFCATVPVTIFNNLINKLTSDCVQLSIDNNVLIVNSGGKYKIPFLVDENGLVVVPNLNDVKRVEHISTIEKFVVEALLKFNKSCISLDIGDCLSGYYIGDKVVTTDENIINIYNKEVFSEPVLLPNNLVNLLSIIPDTYINVYKLENGMYCFVGDNITITGHIRQDIDNYPINDLIAYETVKFEHSLDVPKLLMKEVLSKVGLFIEPYDRNSINLSFYNDGIEIFSKRGNAQEFIRCSDCNTHDIIFKCAVDVNMLKSQIDNMPNDIQCFTLSFGEDNAIKISYHNKISIIALFESEAANE